MKNNIQRKCIATNEITSVDEMIRVVRTKDGNYLVNSNAQGRGAYIKNDSVLIEQLNKKKLLNRTFKTNVPAEVYELLTKEMESE